MTKLNKIIQQWQAGCRQPPMPWYAVSHGYEGGSDLALGLLQLVGKGELGCLLLQLGELVLVLRDLQINELTISVSDMKGKFIKPTLKKVSKYENKFAKLQEKAAKFAFANQLKQSKG